MASPQQDILIIIGICRSALAIPKKSRPPINTQTIEVARKILSRLRDYNPDDTFATIRLNDRLSWWEILYAMEAAEKFLERRLDRKRDGQIIKL